MLLQNIFDTKYKEREMNVSMLQAIVWGWTGKTVKEVWTLLYQQQQKLHHCRSEHQIFLQLSGEAFKALQINYNVDSFVDKFQSCKSPLSL